MIGRATEISQSRAGKEIIRPANIQRAGQLLGRLAERGATIVKPAYETDWGGYSGYFADPDGHHWEVAWNPFWPVREDGRIDFPKG